jgi:hypothetical protein
LPPAPALADIHHDLLGEIEEAIGAKEEAGVDIDIGRHRRPFFADNRIAVKNGPDRATAIVSVVNTGECGIQEIVGIPFEVLGIAPAALNIGIERIVVVGNVLPASLIVKALAKHIYQDDVLPIGDPETGRASAIECGTAGHPLKMPVVVLASDRAGFGHVGTEFADLVVKAP